MRLFIRNREALYALDKIVADGYGESKIVVDNLRRNVHDIYEPDVILINKISKAIILKKETIADKESDHLKVITLKNRDVLSLRDELAKLVKDGYEDGRFMLGRTYEYMVIVNKPLTAVIMGDKKCYIKDYIELDGEEPLQTYNFELDLGGYIHGQED